jgi:hypothetical protein
MTRHESDLLAQIQLRFALQHAHHGHRDGHQGGLGIGGQRQFVGRAFEHQLGQLLAESFVHFLEHEPGGRKGGGQIAAHAGGLAALAGKRECAHRLGNPVEFLGTAERSRSRRTFPLSSCRRATICPVAFPASLARIDN